MFRGKGIYCWSFVWFRLVGRLWVLRDSISSHLPIPFNMLASSLSVEGCKRIMEGRKKGRKETKIPFNSNFILGFQ